MRRGDQFLLWRGTEPNIEWLPIEISDVEHAAYVEEASARLAALTHLAHRKD